MWFAAVFTLPSHPFVFFSSIYHLALFGFQACWAFCFISLHVNYAHSQVLWHKMPVSPGVHSYCLRNHILYPSLSQPHHILESLIEKTRILIQKKKNRKKKRKKNKKLTIYCLALDYVSDFAASNLIFTIDPGHSLPTYRLQIATSLIT